MNFLFKKDKKTQKQDKNPSEVKEKKELPVDGIALDLDELDMVSGGGANNLEHYANCSGMF